MSSNIPWTLCFILVLGAAGCTSSPVPPETSTSDSGHDHVHHDGDAQSDMETMSTELAKLSPNDRASAKEQHLCPVSDKMLGTMGPPQKEEVNAQQVWICCSGCKEELLGNPAKHLAKLKK